MNFAKLSVYIWNERVAIKRKSSTNQENPMDLDDLEPKNVIKKPKDLSGWNIEDLQEYIDAMEVEIERAKEMIGQKQGVATDADALFKR